MENAMRQGQGTKAKAPWPPLHPSLASIFVTQLERTKEVGRFLAEKVRGQIKCSKKEGKNARKKKTTMPKKAEKNARKRQRKILGKKRG